MSDEQKQEEVKEEEVKQEENTELVQSEEAEVKDGRPEINYKKELERKNAEIERLRQAEERRVAQQPVAQNKYDPNDITTWGDNELKTLSRSNDPNLARFRDQAEELLLDRRIRRVRDSERAQEKAMSANVELRTKYPDALDASSAFANRMEEVMYELDLHKSPAGRLAAARIVSAEMTGSKSKTSAQKRNSEDSRIRDVKGQMVDGDRFKSAETANTPKKQAELEKKIKSEGTLQSNSLAEALAKKGISRDNFFPR